MLPLSSSCRDAPETETKVRRNFAHDAVPELSWTTLATAQSLILRPLCRARHDCAVCRCIATVSQATSPSFDASLTAKRSTAS